MSKNTPPTNLTDLYPSEWLHVSDLNGRSYPLTIVSYEVAKFEQSMTPKEWRLVLTFTKTDKKLICNKTQANAVCDIAGSEDFEALPETRITLSPGIAKNRKPTIIITPAQAKKAQPATPSRTAVPAPPEGFDPGTISDEFKTEEEEE